MKVKIGHIEAIFRYPVKSMAAEPMRRADLGWYGLDQDRRLALRRVDNHSGMPWLTAGRYPQLVLFAPQGEGPAGQPSHIRTPDGKSLPFFSKELATEIEVRYGARVEMTHLRHGIFDEANVSVITTDTIGEIGRLSNRILDARRFRPNIVVKPHRPHPFQEDAWVGGVLSFGESDGAPAVAVTMRDERCAMINIDPDSAELAAEVLKAVVTSNSNHAGVYCSVLRVGQLTRGQPVFFKSNH